jgi:Lon protease-like protein
MSDPDASEVLPAGIPEAIPVFPLPDHVLLPGSPSPYRIFEPRYRGLMEYLLELPEAERWLAIPQLVPGSDVPYGGSPPFHAVGTVARLLESQRNPDGTFHIIVGDGVRCRLEELPSSMAFRLARAEPWADQPSDVPAAQIAASLEALRQVVAALAQALGPAARGLSALACEKGQRDVTVFRLGSVLIQHPQRRQEFLECRQPARRVDMLLDAAAVLLSLAGNQGGQVPRS